jgi:FkbM family methyltransferase
MNNFKTDLENKINQSQPNNFGIENYDENRFGKFPEESMEMPLPIPKRRLLTTLKQIVKKIIRYKPKENKQSNYFEEYVERFQKIYETLDSDGQELLIEILAYRMLGYKKVKLSRNNSEYWEALKIGNSLVDAKDTYNPNFMHFILEKCNLKNIGYDILIYFSGAAIAIDFIIEQYAFKINNKPIIQAEEGDIVLDIGACWGDTALYFAHKTGLKGKVFSFEFIPGNIKLFEINTSLNPHLKNQIELIQNPISNKSGDTIYFRDNGPSSTIKFEPFEEQTGFCTTLSIDDFVKNNSPTKVDFIKMDIEGAEPFALQGALETIKKFKPKLAIAIYHSLDDFANIPNWILNLNLNYNIYIGHYTIHSEETVLFASVK